MSFISTLIESIISIIGHLGYLGIAIGMLIESSFIPFPSELILPPAGVLVSRGDMSFILVLVAAIIGSIVGAYINYFIALHFGRRIINKLIGKYCRFLFLKNEALQKADHYFKVHGSITTFTGRLIPAIRQLISIPAGFSKMSLSKFTFYTALGSGLWSAILIYIGVIYGNNQENVNSILSSTTIWMLGIVLLIIAIYFVRKKQKIRV